MGQSVGKNKEERKEEKEERGATTSVDEDEIDVINTR